MEKLFLLGPEIDFGAKLDAQKQLDALFSIGRPGMCRMKFQNTEHGIRNSFFKYGTRNPELPKTTELRNTEFFYKLKYLFVNS
jgi:hypothetical protein